MLLVPLELFAVRLQGTKLRSRSTGLTYQKSENRTLQDFTALC